MHFRIARRLDEEYVVLSILYLRCQRRRKGKRRRKRSRLSILYLRCFALGV